MEEQALIREVVDRVRATLDVTVAAAVELTWAEVASYEKSDDPDLPEDLRLHVDAVFRAVLTAMEEGRPAVPTDFPITAVQAGRRVQQGIPLSDFLKAFRINQVRLWESVIAAASDRQSRDAALHLATRVMQVIEVGSSVAADAYLAAQQLQLVEGDRLRRDLVEDIVAGRVILPGPKADLARAQGIEPMTPVVIGSAVAVKSDLSGAQLRDALSTVRGVLSGGQRGIAALRQDEIVAVAVVPGSVDRLISGLERAQRRLAKEGIELSLGVSTTHHGLAEAPRAYAEAIVAREGLHGLSGTLALSRMTTFDYLVTREDPTARRLIRPAVRQFVEEDQGNGGALIATLIEYARSDLNAKEAAARLHLHVNSAYYRLDKIGERTGSDLRRFADLQELLIAIALLSDVPRRTPRGG
ncbi:PucR family transcriptional regulator [Nocardioides sp. NPDC101246]|uniref:PucR family transcriptional regulator n=1 Tax=Nocardioides sp. NPDC101246 TaxID=3364336 RepID=UPI00381B74D9